MQPISLKTGFLAFSLVAIASISGGILSACSTASNSQVQTPNPTATDGGAAKPESGMGHGSNMNHSMEMMNLGPADANYDLRFIDAMIPHHEGALIMAKEAQQKSKRPEIKQLAEEIIKAQDKEIAQMKEWRQAWYPKASSTPMAWHAQMNHQMAMSNEQMNSMMMKMDLGTADEQFDLRFINAMIPHHEGAVTMAGDALSKSQHPELKQLAQEIVKAQETEIEQMKQWRQAWYKQ